MWSFLIARDTMHQQQWLAVLEELEGYRSQLPVPNSFPHSKEAQEYSYAFFSTRVDGETTVAGSRFTEGPSLDGKGQFSIFKNKPLGQEPSLPSGPAQAHAQRSR